MTGPTINQTPEQIAERLSEAQKRWLLDAWYGRSGWQINYRKKACDLGLTEPNSGRLSPLGHSVREILITKEARRG